MAAQAVAKKENTLQEIPEYGYYTRLSRRFSYTIRSRNNPFSWTSLAFLMNRPAMQIKQFAEGIFDDYLSPMIAKDVEAFLVKYETEETRFEDDICQTSFYTEIFQTCQFARDSVDMAIIDGQAGSGKSVALRDFKRRDPLAIMITLDPLTKAPSTVLPLIGKQVPVNTSDANKSQILQNIIGALTNSKRLLIVDEAHFCSWETLETLRRIHDAAQVGVILCGQERLYKQMKDPKSGYLWDQISSRIGIRATLKNIRSEDTEMICLRLCPGLDPKCLKYLHQIAQDSGRFRLVAKILKKAIKFADIDKEAVSYELIQSIAAQHIL